MNPPKKSGPGNVNRAITYACTRCGRKVPRDSLTVKMARFMTMGERAKLLRSRTTDWLCKTCLNADPDWNRKPLSGSPGFQDVREVKPPERKPKPKEAKTE